MTQDWPASVQRLGVYGGAFDPPHLAHAALAQAACEQLSLDAVCILPTGQAWHKARNLTAAEHRVAMARLAFQAVPQAHIDTREITRGGPSYTVDTLRELKELHPLCQLYLLIGADQAQSLPQWHEINEIKRLAIICVAGRDAPLTPSPLQAAPHGASVVAGDFQPIVLPLMPHSATDVRQRVALGQPLNGLVCDAVASYIHDHHLYLTAR